MEEQTGAGEQVGTVTLLVQALMESKQMSKGSNVRFDKAKGVPGIIAGHFNSRHWEDVQLIRDVPTDKVEELSRLCIQQLGQPGYTFRVIQAATMSVCTCRQRVDIDPVQPSKLTPTFATIQAEAAKRQASTVDLDEEDAKEEDDYEDPEED